MNPRFSTKTIDKLGKHARWYCSNPDCRKATVGRGETDIQTTNIGEAAHIFGAKPTSARYDPQMSDLARAEITNGIWLCRNCHGIIDNNPSTYPAKLLFAWREEHESYITSTVGTRTDQLHLTMVSEELEPFLKYPQRVQRIVRDKPEGWEWRLTAEILKHINQPLFQRLRDLETGLYNKPGAIIAIDGLYDWMMQRVREMLALAPAFTPLVRELTKSWGKVGEEGDLDRIRQICELLNDAIVEVVSYEEHVQSAIIPTEYETVRDVVAHHIGRQILKLEDIPDQIDATLEKAVAHREAGSSKPYVQNWEYTFELPKNWSRRIEVVARHLQAEEVPPEKNHLK